MTLNDATTTPRQETSEEQDIILESFLNLSNNERLANMTAEIDSIVRNRKEAERRAAVSKIKELAQRYEINLSEIST